MVSVSAKVKIIKKKIIFIGNWILRFRIVSAEVLDGELFTKKIAKKIQSKKFMMNVGRKLRRFFLTIKIF